MSDAKTPITAQIEQAVGDIPGWTPIDQLVALFTLAFASADRPGDMLEVGSWCGRSAVALGMAARLAGRSVVHCVDLFPERDEWVRNADGTYSLKVQADGKTFLAYHDQTVWAEPFERQIAPVYETYSGTLEAFDKAIADNRLAPWVKARKGDMAGFAAAAPKGFALRLAFLDGDHGHAAVVNDIELVERFLVPGGWLCFDDAFTTYDGVNRAIEERVLATGRYGDCQQLTRKLFVARRR